MPTIRQANSLRRHQAFEFFKPVLHDDDFLPCFARHTAFLDHQEPLAVGSNIVLSGTGSEVSFLEQDFRK